MTAVMAYQFEGTALDQFITALCMAPVQMCVALVWLAAMTTRFFMNAWSENWRLIAVFAVLVAVPVALALVPQVAAGVAVIAVYGKVTRRYV